MKNAFNKYGNKYQKTTLTDGFIAAVGNKPTLIPQAKVNKIYHKLINLSNIKKYLRGPDGIRTRTFCLGGNWSTINLPAQFTEAGLFSQKLDLKVNYFLGV